MAESMDEGNTKYIHRMCNNIFIIQFKLVSTIEFVPGGHCRDPSGHTNCYLLMCCMGDRPSESFLPNIFSEFPFVTSM